MPVPELHSEIWAQIIPHLVRPSPSSPHDLVPWSELHQHDLTTVSRLNSTMQALAAPHLYTHVTAESFPAFIRGYTSPTASTSQSTPSPLPTPSSTPTLSDGQGTPTAKSRILTKNELLVHTKHWHLIPKSIDFEQVSYAQLLAGEQKWHRIAETITEWEKRSEEEACRMLLELNNALMPLESHRHGDTQPLMPKLENVMLGRKNPTGWVHIYNRHERESLLHQFIRSVRQAFTTVLMACRPRAICDHIDSGPYKLHTIELPADLTKLEYTAHLHKPCLELALFLGAGNQIFAEPGVNFRDDADGDDPYISFDAGFAYSFFLCVLRAEVASLWKTSNKANKQRLKDTDIEIYGICRRAEGDEACIDESLTERYLFEEEWNDHWFMTLWDKKQFLKDQESELIAYIEEEFLPMYPARWKDRIRLFPWSATYDCDTCDWLTVGEGDNGRYTGSSLSSEAEGLSNSEDEGYSSCADSSEGDR